MSWWGSKKEETPAQQIPEDDGLPNTVTFKENLSALEALVPSCRYAQENLDNCERRKKEYGWNTSCGGQMDMLRMCQRFKLQRIRLIRGCSPDNEESSLSNILPDLYKECMRNTQSSEGCEGAVSDFVDCANSISRPVNIKKYHKHANY